MIFKSNTKSLKNYLTPAKFERVTLRGLTNYSIYLIQKTVKYGFKCVACREITGP